MVFPVSYARDRSPKPLTFTITKTSSSSNLIVCHLFTFKLDPNTKFLILSKSVMSQIHDFSNKIITSYNTAVESKSIVSFTTKSEIVDDHGTLFLVKIAENLIKKPTHLNKESQSPFLPPFQFPGVLILFEIFDLFFLDLVVFDPIPGFDSHRLLFNKFNVVPYHLLVCTAEYEEQDSGLSTADLNACEVVSSLV
jgi:ATP adenylyltransferase/5',5'''-P-1,P-4-tetraphosphate phosphorylase II